MLRDLVHYRDRFEAEEKKRLAVLNTPLSLLSSKGVEELTETEHTAIMIMGSGFPGALDPARPHLVISGYPAQPPLLMGSFGLVATISTSNHAAAGWLNYDRCLHSHLVERAGAMPAQYVTVLAKNRPLLKHGSADKFDRLTKVWRETRNDTGSVNEMCMNAAYQQIIGMGEDAVPLILRELEHEVDHWFWALAAVTGANPVPVEQRGRLRMMAEAWLRWGKDQGYKW